MKERPSVLTKAEQIIQDKFEEQLKNTTSQIIVPDSLNLFGFPHTTIHTPLKVYGNLRLAGSKIQKFWSSVIVYGDLDLRGSQLEQAPPFLQVSGDIYASEMADYFCFEKLRAGGDVFLKSSNVHFSEQCTISGSVDLRHSLTEALPENFHLSGDLLLQSSKMKALPESLTVGGALCLQYSQITRVPEAVFVGTEIRTTPDQRVVVESVEHANQMPHKTSSIYLSSGLSATELLVSLETPHPVRIRQKILQALQSRLTIQHLPRLATMYVKETEEAFQKDLEALIQKLSSDKLLT